MHAAYDAHDEATLLSAVHEGHQDLASFLYVPDSLHLLHEDEAGKEGSEGQGGRGRVLWVAGIREKLLELDQLHCE